RSEREGELPSRHAEAEDLARRRGLTSGRQRAVTGELQQLGGGDAVARAAEIAARLRAIVARGHVAQLVPSEGGERAHYPVARAAAGEPRLDFSLQLERTQLQRAREVLGERACVPARSRQFDPQQRLVQDALAQRLAQRPQVVRVVLAL